MDMMLGMIVIVLVVKSEGDVRDDDDDVGTLQYCCSTLRTEIMAAVISMDIGKVTILLIKITTIMIMMIIVMKIIL
jgi:hypothetical protein